LNGGGRKHLRALPPPKQTPVPTSSIAVKVCGVTNIADALASVAAGADMLGFNFYARSRRFVTVDRAAEIIRQLRKSGSDIRCIGVFVDADAPSIRTIATEAALDGVQLHGNEGPEVCGQLQPLRVIKALRVHTGFDPTVANNFDCDTILLDAWNANQPGGTGETFDWSVAAEIRERVERLILAGGLGAENVAAAIREVRPDAVDVCSGVEDAPGRKSAAKIHAFVEAVRTASAATPELVPPLTS